jgi:hypothetical protein
VAGSVRKAVAAALIIAALGMTVPGWAAPSVALDRVRGDGPYRCVLKATKLGPQLMLTYALRSQVPGRVWHVKIWDNKILVYSRDRVANAKGSFAAKAETKNLRGPDTVLARGRNTKTGQVCRIDLKV